MTLEEELSLGCSLEDVLGSLAGRFFPPLLPLGCLLAAGFFFGLFLGTFFCRKTCSKDEVIGSLSNRTMARRLAAGAGGGLLKRAMRLSSSLISSSSCLRAAGICMIPRREPCSAARIRAKFTFDGGGRWEGCCCCLIPRIRWEAVSIAGFCAAAALVALPHFLEEVGGAGGGAGAATKASFF